MTHDDNIRNFTAADIEKYHKGLLSSQQRHALEKAALDDPFLADALEGYALAGANPVDDIDDLKKRLAEKTQQAKVIPLRPGGKRSFPLLSIAVILLLIIGGGLIAFQLLYKSNGVRPPVAQDKSVPQNTPVQPASPGANPDQSNASSEKVALSRDQTKSGRTFRDTVSKAPAAELVTTGKSPAPVYTKTDSADRLSAAIAQTEPPKTDQAAANQVRIAPDRSDSVKLGNEVASARSTTNAPATANTEGMMDKSEARKAKEVSGYTNDNYRNVTAFRGKVTDNNNNALPFANITNTRDNVGTYSDAQGNFTLVSTDSVLNVQVKSLGFLSKNAQLRNVAASNKITMQEDRNLPIDTLDKVKRNVRRNHNNSMTLEDPEPEDGWDSYSSYVMNNVNIPETFNIKQLSEPANSTVEVSFEVNKNGEPVNLKIEKSLCDKCDQEAKRLIKDGPRWKRKTKKTKRATVTIPFIRHE